MGSFRQERRRASLVEDGALGGLEDDVVAGIAARKLAFDFFGEVVLFVLGFPVAVGKVVEVHEGAVHDDGGAGTLDAVFGNESELGPGLASAFVEQILKGAADGAFVVEVQLAELMERVVVGLDGGVRRLEGEGYRAMRGRRSLQRGGNRGAGWVPGVQIAPAAAVGFSGLPRAYALGCRTPPLRGWR